MHQPTPVYPEVACSSGHDVIDTAAQEVAKTWNHMLAPQEGAPVTRWAEISLTFKLDK